MEIVFSNIVNVSQFLEIDHTRWQRSKKQQGQKNSFERFEVWDVIGIISTTKVVDWNDLKSVATNKVAWKKKDKKYYLWPLQVVESS
jgi:hypothetical protein